MFSDKDLRKLIVPLVIEQILAVLVGTADTVMVSYAGESAISGVSLVAVVLLFGALRDDGIFDRHGDRDGAGIVLQLRGFLRLRTCTSCE